MPTGTTVEKVYKALRREGMDEGKAARIAQSQTGKALATGRPPKRRHGVATANKPPGGQDLSLVPSSRRTTEALAQQTEPKQRYIDRLIRLGYSPADAQAKVERVLAGKTPEEIAEHVRRDERLPDSYLAPGGITGSTTDARDSFRRAMNARSANRSRGRRFANEPEPGGSAPDPLAVPTPGKTVALTPHGEISDPAEIARHLKAYNAAHPPMDPRRVEELNRGTLARRRTEEEMLQTRAEQDVARENRPRLRIPGVSREPPVGLSSNESENLTTPSSQRVTPSPGNQVLKELRRDKVMRQRMERAEQPLPEF